MSFDKKFAKNVEEHSLSVLMCVHVSGLRMQLIFLHTQNYSCVRGLCSCIRVRIL